METEILRIKCPHCGTELAVAKRPDMVMQMVTCPQCNSRSPYTSYQLLGTIVDPKIAATLAPYAQSVSPKAILTQPKEDPNANRPRPVVPDAVDSNRTENLSQRRRLADLGRGGAVSNQGQSPRPQGGGGNSSAKIFIMAMGGVVVVALIAILIVLFLKSGNKKQQVVETPAPVVVEETTVPSTPESTPSRVTEEEDQAAAPAQGPVNLNGHEGIDLGLGVKWATCNVGASKASDVGEYYAWGDVATKKEYTEQTSKTYQRNIPEITGDITRDPATVKWGQGWRLPTKAEIKALCQKCKWTWTTQGGRKGYLVTGPSGESIFLPAGGYRYSATIFDSGVTGGYWAGSPSPSDHRFSYYMDFNDKEHSWYLSERYIGRNIRAVTDK